MSNRPQSRQHTRHASQQINPTQLRMLTEVPENALDDTPTGAFRRLNNAIQKPVTTELTGQSEMLADINDQRAALAKMIEIFEKNLEAKEERVKSLMNEAKALRAA